MNDINATVEAPDQGATAEPPVNATSTACIWCGRPFRTRRGGSPKRFCSATHRIAFWSALRRWGERAVASGILTVADVRDGAAVACTLPPGGISPAAISRDQKAAPVPPAASPDGANELLDDFLIALLDLPGDTWPDLAAALPNELFDRIDRYLEARLS